MKTFVKLLGLFCCLTVLFNSCSFQEYPPEFNTTVYIDGELWWAKNSDIKTLRGLIISGDWTTPGTGKFQFVDGSLVFDHRPSIVADGDVKDVIRDKYSCYYIHDVKPYTVTVWDQKDGTSVTTVEFKSAYLTGTWYFEGDRLVLRDNNNEVYKKIELSYGGQVREGGYIKVLE